MLFKLEDKKLSEYQKVKKVTLADIGWKEKNLEELISKNIQDFISLDTLMVIFNERIYQEEPDILALDKFGTLYIFELKRWTGKQENLLQVLRYGQIFGKSTYEELNELYKKYLKNDKSDLSEDHKKYFQLIDFDKDNFNSKQKFLIVTNGVDQETIESKIYWKNLGINIDAIIYWVFEINNEYYIEFNMYSQIENFLQYENNCYILNTNLSTDSKYTNEMLLEEKAAAYYPGWREKIKKFQKGDVIFLYKNGEGIIAYGKADGKLNKCACDGHDDYEYNMKLYDFKKLSSPLSAAEIKVAINSGINFRQTLTSISEESYKKIIKAINKKI